MNNKILARVVALVLAVMMLGTVSFAADKQLTPAAPDANGYAAQATKTVLAFATNDEQATAPEANADIVAVIQDANVPTTITIDDSKIAGKNYVVVLFGGTNGVTDKAIIDVSTGATLEAIVVDKTVTIDGQEYTNVAAAKFSFAVPTGKTAASYGLKFNSYNSEGIAVGTEKEFKSTTEVVGGGTVNFGAVVFGVPATGLQGAAIKAVPFVNYK